MLKKIICCILFMGILPCDAAMFTWFRDSALGSRIVLMLNIITCLIAGFYLVMNFGGHFRYEGICLKYVAYFIAMIILNAIAATIAVEDEELATRTMSLLCVCAYYLFAVYAFRDTEELIKTINTSLLLLIVLSVILYYTNYEYATFIEVANVRHFKGVAANRNSYAEITLFYVITNVYLWAKSKKNTLYYVVTTALAVYTTFATRSATATICVAFMGLLALIYFFTGRMISFKVAVVAYTVIFISLIVLRSADTPFLSEVIALFQKGDNLTGRVDLWEATFSELRKYPWFGQGYDTKALFYLGFDVLDPHNSVLYTLLTQGIVGAVLFAWFFGTTMLRGERMLKGNLLYSMLYVYILTWMLRGLTESVFSYPHFSFWVALIIIDKEIRDKRWALATGKDQNEGKIYKYTG